MINRTQLSELSKTRHFFFSEIDASAFSKKINAENGGDCVIRIDQLQLFLDDISEQELIERKARIENIINDRINESLEKWGKDYVNDAQKNLLRSVYVENMDMWEVTLLSTNSKEFYHNPMDVMMIEDELDGWVRA
jgi:hypothetical protein